MSELNVIIRYKSPQARTLFVLVMLLIPVWGIAAPLALCNFLFLVFQGAATTANCMAIFTLLPFIVFCLATLIFSEDNRIHVSKEGLTMPTFLLSKFRFRKNISWSELISAGVVTTSSGATKKLVLGLDSGKSVALDLDAIALDEQEQLLLGLELRAPETQRSLEFNSYQKELQDRARSAGTPGYTQIWEEELERRFSSTPFVPLEPGTMLQGGTVKVLRQLAFGGLSALYLAQRNGVDLVVLKEAVVPQNSEPLKRREAEAYLIREAEMLVKLNHERISKVLGHFVEDDRQYLLLEYINGADLRQYVSQNGPISELRAIEWGLQIAAILRFLHNQDIPIIHRDLTPENVVLNKHDQLILIDFGASNMFLGTATGTVVGKHAYIPAEQLRGKASLQSDVYSFGGTLYFLLTGQDPKPLSVGHPRIIKVDLSLELDDFVAKCLAFDDTDRYQNADELIIALTRISAGLSQVVH